MKKAAILHIFIGLLLLFTASCTKETLNPTLDPICRVTKIDNSSPFSTLHYYDFDDSGRLLRIRYVNRYRDTTLHIDTVQYDSNGKIIRMDGESGHAFGITGEYCLNYCPKYTTFTYDAYGRVAEATIFDKFSNTVERTEKYEYDASGRVTKVTFPSGFYFRNEYNASGNLFKVYKLIEGSQERLAIKYLETDNKNNVYRSRSDMQFIHFFKGILTAYNQNNPLKEEHWISLASVGSFHEIYVCAYEYDRNNYPYKRTTVDPSSHTTYEYDCPQ